MGPRAAPPPLGGTSPRRAPAKARRVLVVDDDADTGEALRNVLERREPDLHVVVAGDGPSALELLRRGPVGVLVADYRMPGMDGVEFLTRAARVEPAAARVLITAYPDIGVAVQAVHQAGVDRFLSKPVSAPMFHATIRDLLVPPTPDQAWDHALHDDPGEPPRRRAHDP